MHQYKKLSTEDYRVSNGLAQFWVVGDRVYIRMVALHHLNGNRHRTLALLSVGLVKGNRKNGTFMGPLRIDPCHRPEDSL